ncbi:MAG: glutamate racemase, partial [Candidatus Kapabacteria bacterium]|nr:glutamate racemase [Candidatus Kapabacteria bacterium]
RWSPVPIRTYGQPCPLFVPLVEEGWVDHPVTEQIAEHYLAPLRTAGVDTLILGCTHYPLLLPVLRHVLSRCCFVESGEAIVQHLKKLGHTPAFNGPTAQLHLQLTDTPGPALEHILQRLRLTSVQVQQICLREYV